MKIKVSENLVELAQIFSKFGKLYIVGGYVRNSLLGFTDTDLDLASDLSPEKISSILKNSKFEIVEMLTSLGVVRIKCGEETYEHTTFRRDNYFNSGAHRVESVNYVQDLQEDAMRRDFTINSLYYEILTKKIVDIYSGLLDLKTGTIRTVEVPGYVLAHDGVRILRMVRLASELNFKIDYATFITARKNTILLKDISPARKYAELSAILNAPQRYPISKKDSHIKGVNYFNDLKIWNYFFIPTSRVRVKMLKKATPKNVFYMFLIDVIDTINPACIEYFIKDLLGANGFNLSANFISHTNTIICGYYDAINKMNNKSYFFKYFTDFEEIADLIYAKSKKLYAKYKFFYSYIKKHKLPVFVKELKINGEDLKKNFPHLPEKKYSAVLLHLLDKVFDAELANTPETLLAEVKNQINHNLL